MTFDLIAKSLLKTPAAPTQLDGPDKGRTTILKELAAAGFSREDLFNEYRSVYDTCDDDGVKRQILDAMSKIHGLFKEENIKPDLPQIIINVQGDSSKVNMMLCPPQPATDLLEVNEVE